MKLVLEVTKKNLILLLIFTTLDLKNFETIQKIEAYIEGAIISEWISIYL